MYRDWIVRLAEAAAITVTLAVVCQELEKPKEERHWHGRLGTLPYDLRMPTPERLRDAFWNDEDPRIFTEKTVGIGWGINFYALMEKMRLVGECCISEDDFLMPTPTLRKILENRPVLEEV